MAITKRKTILLIVAVVLCAAAAVFLIYSASYKIAQNRRYEEARTRCGSDPVIVRSDTDIWGNVTHDIRTSNDQQAYEYAMKSRGQNEYFCSIAEAKKAYPRAFDSGLNYRESDQKALTQSFIDKLRVSKTKAYKPNVPGGGLSTRILKFESDSYAFTAKNKGHPDTELTCKITDNTSVGLKRDQVGTNYLGRAIYFSDQTHTQRWLTTFPDTECELVIWKESSGSTTPQANIDQGANVMASMREMPVSELLNFEFR